MHKGLKHLSLFLVSILFSSCANQLPPPGGDEDVTPPAVVRISPAENTVNFSGKSIIIEFSEYVDRRSFQDALFISPKPKSDVEINYSGTEVEIFFPDGLEPNRTYTIYIGKTLKDIRRGNPLSEPIQFAISTGSKIDRGRLTGNVYANDYRDIFILAYKLNGSGAVDPGTQVADYISQVDTGGSYSFLNLPEGKYRVFAMDDNDRNLLYDPEFDKIYMTTGDFEVSDTKKAEDVDFLSEDLGLSIGSEEFYNLLKPDTANYIYSSISNNAKEIPPDYRFYFYFPDNDLSRLEIADNVTLLDTASGQTYRPVFNWINDSLLQLFSAEQFRYGTTIDINFDLRNTPLSYYHNLKFTVIEESSSGKVSGRIANTEFPGSPVSISLYNNSNRFISYTAKLYSDTSFTFPNVVEGSYTIFAFVDVNDDGEYYPGQVNPFKPAEKFIIYSEDLKVRGTWSIDNLMLNF